jgi:hypothetical protein
MLGYMLTPVDTTVILCGRKKQMSKLETLLLDEKPYEEA